MAGADYIYCVKCNQKALYYEGDPPDGVMVICASCAALSAGVADQEPDADFAAALDEYRRAAMKLQHIQTVTYRRNPSEHDVDQLDDASVRFDAARARVLALYEQAGAAKLREAKQRIEADRADVPERDAWDNGWHHGNKRAVVVIDAMLKGGE